MLYFVQIFTNKVPFTLHIEQTSFSEETPRGKRKLEFKEKKPKHPKLPLADKTVFLDIKNVRQKRKVEADLKTLGAVCTKIINQSSFSQTV